MGFKILDINVTQTRLKLYALTTIGLNIILSIGGAIYLLTTYFMSYFNSPIWNIIGILMITTWLINLGLIYTDDRVVNKSTPVGEKINKICNYFLVFYILAMFLLLGNNLLLSITISTSKTAIIPPFLLACSGFFAISVFGTYLGWLNFLNINNKEVWKF